MGVGGGQREERVIYTFWNQPGAAFGRNDEPSIAFCFHYFFFLFRNPNSFPSLLSCSREGRKEGEESTELRSRGTRVRGKNLWPGNT